ncbi:MAG: cytochrome ubiquinol oxidase subunit I [Bryobacterales bacterium]|nr:cytochrome ubiquinol oxidase subunit I [Bryobacteraceae bacterium]MDW8353600.1 cytochrome ubiquinol oxidase subunit I [Bryobacterales bacterium]
MDSALAIHRFQFAFTVTYHYLFPQLTMGLALLLVMLKTLALRTGDERYNRSVRFWARIFGINFAMGVVTGIPMEFQFGTNWAPFSRAAGGVIGQTLAMEGVFAFFLESAFLGLLLFGEKRLGPRGHWWAAFLVFLGSWISGFFIVATNAWMQHPVGYRLGPGGEIQLESFWALLTNPWLPWQYLHTMIGSVVTAGFFMASIGAFYLLSGRYPDYGRLFVRVGVIAAFVSSVLMLYPTGDRQGANVARYQPVTLAAMEGLFQTQKGAPIALIGQPDMQKRRLDNPLLIPRMLSFLTYQRWQAEVKGLDAFPERDWPDNIPLLYYSYHIMVGLGTIFIAVSAIAVWKLRRGTLFESRPWLWVLLLMLPFPYIANTAGWFTAELGRQPWVIYGLMRTSEGASLHVSGGNALFTLIGFMGLYAVLSILFLALVCREIGHGPEPADAHAPAPEASHPAR